MTVYINGSPIQVDVTKVTNVNIDDTDSPYQINPGEESLDVDCSTGTVAVVLDNTGEAGNIIIVSDTTGNANVNNITITSTGGTIDGLASCVLSNAWASVTFKYLGSDDWKII